MYWGDLLSDSGYKLLLKKYKYTFILIYMYIYINEYMSKWVPQVSEIWKKKWKLSVFLYYKYTYAHTILILRQILFKWFIIIRNCQINITSHPTTIINAKSRQRSHDKYPGAGL